MKIYTANQYMRDVFSEKVYKISLNAGCTCPNRDGTRGYAGCIFCSESGSGDFSQKRNLSITEQIEKAKERVNGKFKGDHYIGYFQSFTNTYGDIDVLRAKFMEAIENDSICGLSIATRPDCINERVVDALDELSRIKPVWVELGLQTIHEDTARLINRCYELSEYDAAVSLLKTIDVHIITHMIIGLPYETKEDMVATAEYIGNSGVQGIKFQLLNVLKNTALCEMYEKGDFEVLTLDQYIDILRACIEVIPTGMVVHRLTGDGPKSLLVAPLWSGDKKKVLNEINRRVLNDSHFQ